MSKISFELGLKNLLSPIWHWFCQDYSGLHACILCMKRHPEIIENVVTVILYAANQNLAEALTVEMRKVLSDHTEYINNIHQMFRFLSEAQQSKEQVFFPCIKFSNIFPQKIINSGVVKYWLEISQKLAESDAENITDSRISALCKKILLHFFHISHSISCRYLDPIFKLYRGVSRDSKQYYGVAKEGFSR